MTIVRRVFTCRDVSERGGGQKPKQNISMMLMNFSHLSSLRFVFSMETLDWNNKRLYLSYPSMSLSMSY